MNGLLSMLGKTGIGITALSSILTATVIRTGLSVWNRPSYTASVLLLTSEEPEPLLQDKIINSGLPYSHLPFGPYTLKAPKGWTVMQEHSTASELDRTVLVKEPVSLSIFQAPIDAQPCNVQENTAGFVKTADAVELQPTPITRQNIDTTLFTICALNQTQYTTHTPYGIIQIESPHSTDIIDSDIRLILSSLRLTR